jgi:hypothetical protein
MKGSSSVQPLHRRFQKVFTVAVPQPSLAYRNDANDRVTTPAAHRGTRAAT